MTNRENKIIHGDITNDEINDLVDGKLSIERKEYILKIAREVEDLASTILIINDVRDGVLTDIELGMETDERDAS